MNKVMILGNLGQSPELRHTQNGTAVANLRVATNERWKDSNGARQERTEWHSVVVFGRQAENCEKYLNKGSRVLVEGRLQTREYTDKDNNTRYTTEIVAQTVQFLDRSSSLDEDSSPSKTPRKNSSYDPSFEDEDIPF